jgi:hypothetical protein
MRIRSFMRYLSFATPHIERVARRLVEAEIDTVIGTFRGEAPRVRTLRRRRWTTPMRQRLRALGRKQISRIRLLRDESRRTRKRYRLRHSLTRETNSIAKIATGDEFVR